MSEHSLIEATYLSQIDLTNGYYQIAMDTVDIKKIAFSKSIIHYEFLQMPFGLSGALRTFQRE
ncbi:hypothetical protein CWI38_1341p0030 [Hamiltosporidium tvaerminnensis]|uniref:Reverse transcriptase n=1 Tax=Hamiltosporidium tvaerminnensis TaxID=1176355 RepID=A0A4Q9LSC9_9MICR|nr:hypothetical protein CWI38_1341p0030 [Hamiltosporidium tvaerminnensis]